MQPIYIYFVSLLKKKSIISMMSILNTGLSGWTVSAYGKCYKS